tara:strand:+ start:340 stop:1296 length:957 start_codon:yes stop_codon:yes gene_type:complete
MPQTALENEAVEEVVETPEAAEEEFEVVVEDDTPEEDRDREPMPEEIVDNLEKDELEEYSVEKAKQLKKVWHDERRAKEAAQRERDAAVAYAKQQLEENKKFRADLNKGEEALMENSKSSAEHELQLATKMYKEAFEAGEADQVAEAQAKMVSAQSRLHAAENYEPQYGEVDETEQDEGWNIEPQQQQQQVAPDHRTQMWLEENKWFNAPGKELMTMHAKNMHMSLSENGINAEIDPNTYWGSIDKEMRLRYPEEFEGATTGADASPRSAAKAKTVVSSAKRTTKSKQYVLTDSEARLSHRLGITPEEYVKQKLKLEG